ncbi:oxidoreductase [Vibrio maritimus]|uniref:oxidoreductase n=1 Tax=Vibrio maritimus TaxID=990268 RepID=UPI004068306C
MTQNRIKTAIIGYGFSAKTFQIPFITTLPEFELTAISTSQADEVNSAFSDVTHYASAISMIEETDAELVIITAPNHVHFELAKLALESGKHVVIEKPFVTRIEDGEALIEMAKKHSRVLSIYHNRRWDGDFLTVKKLIEEEKLGDIKHFESHYDRFRPQVRQRWREQTTDGGGILFDLGSHLIDQAVELFGVPDYVSAECKMRRENSTNVDYFHVILHYPEHLAILHGDMFDAGPNRRFTVKGTLGNYEKCGFDPQEAQLISGVLPNTLNWSEETHESYGTLYQEGGSEAVKTELGAYQDYFKQLATSIQDGLEPPVKPEEALQVIRLIELAMESSRLGKKVAVGAMK